MPRPPSARLRQYHPEAREPAPAPSHYYSEPAPSAPSQMTTNGVYLEPVGARPTYGEPRMQEPAPRMMAEQAPSAYVPPAPEMPRTPRMPSIEDFPKPVQDQMRQHRGEAPQHDPRRKSIFERLASFGASRQEDGTQPAQAQQPQTPPRAPAQQPPQGVSEYAKRPAQAPQGHAQLDPHGRRPRAVASGGGGSSRDPGLPAPPVEPLSRRLETDEGPPCAGLRFFAGQSTVIASEAKQSRAVMWRWIASSLRSPR